MGRHAKGQGPGPARDAISMTRQRAALQLFRLLWGPGGRPGSATPAGSNWRGLAGAASAAVAAAATAAAPAASLAPGSVFSSTKRFTPEEVAAFAAHTGDSNPIHVDAGAAQRQGLPAPILPGMLMASLFPAIIGSSFPGAVYLSQTLKFKHHALVGGWVGGCVCAWVGWWAAPLSESAVLHAMPDAMQHRQVHLQALPSPSAGGRQPDGHIDGG